MIVAPGATLSTPIPLPLAAAMIPLTWVPWPSPSCGGRVALDHVVALADVAREVRVVGLHAGVDDRHDRAGAGGDLVGGVGLDQVEVPLLAAPRVGGARRSGEEQEREQGEGDGPEHGAKGDTPKRLYAITYVRMEVATHVGSRVRALREGMDLSLRDLAQRSGVSAPMLSQVERGETSPTLTVANRIAAGLDLRLSQLLRLDEGGTVTVVRPSDRRSGGADGHRWEVLTPPLPGQRAEVSTHTLQPGARTGGPGDPPMHEPGARETSLVQRGTLTFVCDGARHELATGDCVTFDADLPHHFENPGEEEAVLLAVVSAGLRRS